MKMLKNLRLISGGLGKKSGLGLLLSMAKKELQRTEGMLTQVQEIRALQSQLDRHETHSEQVRQLKDSQGGGNKTKVEPAVSNSQSQDVAANLDDLRRQEVEYKQQLQTFLDEYKKRGLPQ